jgi:uncharacterized membrane protein
VIMFIFMVFALSLLAAGVGIARRCRSRARGNHRSWGLSAHMGVAAAGPWMLGPMAGLVAALETAEC